MASFAFVLGEANVYLLACIFVAIIASAVDCLVKSVVVAINIFNGHVLGIIGVASTGTARAVETGNLHLMSAGLALAMGRILLVEI